MMIIHKLRVYPSRDNLPKENQLAWKFFEVALDPVPVDPDVINMIQNRIIDNAAVAIASIERPPVKAAFFQALAHPRAGGALLLGFPPATTVHAEWAAWANGTAVRELDMHDTFLAADYSHPADNIPPLVAVAQQCGASGMDLIRGILAAYEIQINLVRAICLHKHKIDHIAHLGPSAAAGIGALLGLKTEHIYQAVQQALHVTCTTRQSRKGEISSWKAYAPAHAGKMAIEAVDRAMRGEKSPSPIYEGEDSVVACLLDGPEAEYSIPLPAPGEPKRAILDSFTKEHSAEYQAQALIDLAFNMRGKISNFEDIEKIDIYTSHHTHHVIGSGAGDPQKMDPNASRETLDHSIMYIFAVALQDGTWHHIDSYLHQRAARPDTVRLWRKVCTFEDPVWTRRYNDPDPDKRAFGGRVVIHLKNKETIADELSLANAHPKGAKPFTRPDYIKKFRVLTDGLVKSEEQNRFLEKVQKLSMLKADELQEINISGHFDSIFTEQNRQTGIF